MISHRHRCIYIKVPKCASTSVRDWFMAHAGARHSFPPYWYAGDLAERLQWVARAMELYPDYRTFTFVRNPFGRFLSLYRHANRIAAAKAERFAEHPPGYGTLGEFAALCAELLADTGSLWGAPATAFFHGHADRRYGPLGIRLRHCRYLFTHARPQVDFLPDCNPRRLFGRTRPNADPADFIGTVETLGADFERLKARLGLPPAPLLRRNASPSLPEPEEAYDAANRRLVGELYARDIEFTGCGPDDAPVLRRSRSLRRSRGTQPAPRLRRAAYTVRTLEIGLEARLRRIAPLRARIAPLARRIRRLD